MLRRPKFNAQIIGRIHQHTFNLQIISSKPTIHQQKSTRNYASGIDTVTIQTHNNDGATRLSHNPDQSTNTLIKPSNQTTQSKQNTIQIRTQLNSNPTQATSPEANINEVAHPHQHGQAQTSTPSSEQNQSH